MIKYFFLVFKNKPVFLWVSLVLLSLMFGNVFFVKKESDFTYIILLAVWFWANKRFKIDARFSIVLGLLFLLVCPFLMLFNEYLAMRAGVWAFLLFLSGSILSYQDNKA